MIKDFLEKIFKKEVNDCCCNHYYDCYKFHEITRNNLKIYFNLMKEKGCDTLLVGEAPGYKGCKLSGVPFTSEYILKNGNYFNLFGADKGYKGTSDYLSKEQSATIVWNTLLELNFLPLMWNAFPFHPYKKENPFSNRTPLRNELEIGKFFITELIQIFDIKHILAIGNKANKSLTEMGINNIKVRHPANGGKKEFVIGLKTFLATKK